MLSWIASDFFAQSPLLAYPIVALAIFVSLFCVISLRAALFSDPKKIEQLARMPLDEEAHHD